MICGTLAYACMYTVQSEANVSGIIVSDPEVGTKLYGLTPHGRQQVVQVGDSEYVGVG